MDPRHSIFLLLAALIALTAGLLASADRGVPAVPATSPAEAVSRRQPVFEAPAYASVLIRDVPHVRQKPDFCGEACAAMILKKLGVSADQDYVFDQSGLDPLMARGCWTKELAAALRKIGFQTGPVWHQVSAENSAPELERLWNLLHADLQAGVASIVCTHFDDRPNTTEHFRLILGYDAATDELLYHEPAVPQGSYLRMPRKTLLELWPLKYNPQTWTVIRLRMEPARIARPAISETFTAADFAQHMMMLRKKIPEEGFTIVLQPPFVVIGDEASETVKRRAEGTVKWAVDKLKASYFEKDPLEILDIWLFKDKESYEKHTQAIFGHLPTTPFGYYSSTDRALVMNIQTGGGTLVHEIVHPFMAANFPNCPAWLNEGMGSLYEQCGEVNGKIRGQTNWRLAGLQEAIRRGSVPTFQELCSTTDDQFYNQDKGTNYAQARYLCFYLQEHELLEKFYHRFVADSERDPSGYQTLKTVLGRGDMKTFQKDWESYVLKLRFPDR